MIDTSEFSPLEGEKSLSTSSSVEEALVKRENTGWVSPHYNISRSVALDHDLMQKNRCIAFGDLPETDAYRVLRTRILQKSGDSVSNTLMVTSALPGEGKTLTAVNLALTFAKQFNQTVLLVDCDLRHQDVCRLLGYIGEKGLVSHLVDNEPLKDIIVWPGIEKLTVISGGRWMTSGSSELLGSPGMRHLVHELKNRYPERLVVFDAPPILAGADALAFAPLVEKIVLVVAAEQTSGKDVHKALSLLPKEKILGTVLNKGRAVDGRYPAGSRSGDTISG